MLSANRDATTANRKHDAKAWCVYLIRTRRGTLYTGISNDFQRRWLHHLQTNRGAKFFRTSAPEKLEYLEPAADRSTASRREAQIKKLTRNQKETLIRCQAPYSPTATTANRRSQSR